MVKFTYAVMKVFIPEYLREPNAEDTEKLTAIGVERGFPEMIGSMKKLINMFVWSISRSHQRGHNHS